VISNIQTHIRTRKQILVGTTLYVAALVAHGSRENSDGRMPRAKFAVELPCGRIFIGTNLECARSIGMSPMRFWNVVVQGYVNSDDGYEFVPTRIEMGD